MNFIHHTSAPLHRHLLLSSASQSLGCDDYLGSEKVVDKCGVCGGDNTTCRLVSGVFSHSLSKIGYHKIVEIPEGATNINVTEMLKSRNYLGRTRNRQPKDTQIVIILKTVCLYIKCQRVNCFKMSTITHTCTCKKPIKFFFQFDQVEAVTATYCLDPISSGFQLKMQDHFVALAFLVG